MAPYYVNVIQVGLSMIFIILLGFVCTKFNFIPKRESDVVNKFVFRAGFFCLTIRSLAGKTRQELNFYPLVIGGLMSISVYLLTALMLLYPFKDRWSQYLSTVFPGNYINYVISGVPIFQALWEPKDEVMIPIITLSNDLITSPIFLCLGAIYQLKKQAQTHPGERPLPKGQMILVILKKIFSNPILLGNLVGLLYVCTNLPVPIYLRELFNMLGDLCLPLSLYCVGAFLSQHSLISCHWLKFLAAFILRAFIGPFFATVFAYALPLKPRLARQCVIMATQPTAVACFQLALNAGVGPGSASTLIFWTTLLTVPILICWVEILDGLNLFVE